MADNKSKSDVVRLHGSRARVIAFKTRRRACDAANERKKFDVMEHSMTLRLFIFRSTTLRISLSHRRNLNETTNVVRVFFFECEVKKRGEALDVFIRALRKSNLKVSLVAKL